MALDEWNTAELELGFDVPAHVGLAESEIETPCLIVDLAAFERNVATMKQRAAELDVVLRVHGKMHKSSAVARYQMAHGGAVG
ncbi:MAG: DSD1 family PLP-dependent enzyme, partial [Pseudomonadota bacterium]